MEKEERSALLEGIKPPAQTSVGVEMKDGTILGFTFNRSPVAYSDYIADSRLMSDMEASKKFLNTTAIMEDKADITKLCDYYPEQGMFVFLEVVRIFYRSDKFKTTLEDYLKKAESPAVTM